MQIEFNGGFLITFEPGQATARVRMFSGKVKDFSVDSAWFLDGKVLRINCGHYKFKFAEEPFQLTIILGQDDIHQDNNQADADS